MNPQKINIEKTYALTVAYNQNEPKETSTIDFIPGHARLQELLSRDYSEAVQAGVIPGMDQIMFELQKVCMSSPGSTNALEFIQTMQSVSWSRPEMIPRFQMHTNRRIVIMDDARIKVVLILWNPGEESSIHGHPQGGCLFKVLSGQVEEKRYNPQDNGVLQSINAYYEGAVAYLDNRMSYHAVSNPTNQAAITLHAYTH